jgi:hypothetical protein
MSASPLNADILTCAKQTVTLRTQSIKVDRVGLIGW